MIRILVVVAAVLASSAALAQKPVFIPSKGFVPDASTATAIARAVLIPIYGAVTIRSEEPLKAERHGTSWYVNGTLQCIPNCLGGTAFVEISAKDGTILNVFHTK